MVKRLALFFIVTLTAVACANNNASGFAPLPGQSAADAQATINAYNLQSSATRDAVAQQTAIAVNATQQANVEATAVAQITQAAGTSTAESLEFRATEIALSMLMAQATATKQYQDAQATGVAAIEATAEFQRQRNIEMLRQDELVRLQQKRLWKNVLNGALMLLILVATVVLGYIGITLVWRMKHINQKPLIQHDQNGRAYLVDHSNQGLLSGPRLLVVPNGRPALPAPVVESVPRLTAVSGSPDWQMMQQWRSRARIPLGVGADGRPILIDRNREPHLMIVGSTGTGKTTSGLLPFATAMLGAGLHVVLVNGRGADYAPLQGIANVTIMPQVSRDERPLALEHLLRAVIGEIDRRDGVLARYGVRSWHDLPHTAGESGEILIAIDEFLGLIGAAKSLDKQTARGMWRCLIDVTSEARKFGIYLLLTATDPTGRAMSESGLTVRDQMARMVFGMKNPDASRKIIGQRLSDWPDGSTDLPPGQFLSVINGRATHGRAFHPSGEQIRSFLTGRNLPPAPLPDGLLRVASGGQIVPAGDLDENGVQDAIIMPERPHPYSSTISQEEDDGQRLDGLPEGMRKSRNQAACWLTGRERGGDGKLKASGDDYQRLERALLWRIRNCNGRVGWERKIL